MARARRGALVVAAVLVVLVAVLAVRQVPGWWHAEPYPVANPAEVGGELHAASQTVYGTLDLTREEKVWVVGSPCPERGRWDAGWNPSPPDAPDVYSMSQSWAVEMPPYAIADAMYEARDALVADGWRVTEESTRADRTYVALARGGMSYSMFLGVAWDEAGEYAGARLESQARAGCARISADYSGARPESYAEWDLGLPPLTADQAPS
ncbi:hypothetical protein [Streptomyces sp. B6B3]|uniref:hypothetical protein n=1 Tax=Streptomyces sp. B6B3 TaxID=3153570 RepID=UPI00325D264B